MPKHKVLVPLDGSVFGYQIFPVITNLLDANANELILLRIDSDGSGHVGGPARSITSDGSVKTYDTVSDFEQASHPIYASQVRDSALAEFRATTQPDARALEAAGFKVSYDIRFGSTGEEIVKYVEANPVDLIAMTTHWRTGINKLLFGNTVQHIVSRVKAPLLMLRPEEIKDEA